MVREPWFNRNLSEPTGSRILFYGKLIAGVKSTVFSLRLKLLSLKGHLTLSSYFVFEAAADPTYTYSTVDDHS